MVWVKTENYWDLYFRLLEEIKMLFSANDIEMPSSKIDLNIINN